MKTRAALAALLMLAAHPAPAQGPKSLSEWMLPAGQAEAVASVGDGGVVLAGRSQGAARLIHVDAKGKIREDWPLPGSDAWPRALATPPGALMLAAGPGMPVGFEHGMAVWRLVVSENGKLHQDWLRRFRRTPLDGAQALVALDDGGAIVAGWTGGQSAPNGGAWILRLDADGEVAWRRIATPVAPDGVFSARAAARAANGDLLIAAYGALGDGLPGAVWVLRFDMAGNDTTQKVVDDFADEHPEALAAFTDGGHVLGGWAQPVDQDGPAFGWLVRCDDKGDVVWRKRFQAKHRSAVNAIAILPGEEMLVAGQQDGQNWLARLDAQGEVLWEKRLGAHAEGLKALALPAEGVAVAVGARGSAMLAVKIIY